MASTTVTTETIDKVEVTDLTDAEKDALVAALGAVSGVTGDGVDNTDAQNPVITQTSASDPVNGVSTVTNFDGTTQGLIDESAFVENADGSCSITIGAKTTSFPPNAVAGVSGDGVDNADPQNPVITQTSAANPVNGVSTVTNFDGSTQGLVDESAFVENPDGSCSITIGSKTTSFPANAVAGVTGDGVDNTDAQNPVITQTAAGVPVNGVSTVTNFDGSTQGLVDESAFVENADGSCSITIGSKTASFPANALEGVTGDGVDNTDAANPVITQTSAANPVNGVSTITNFDGSTQGLVDESAFVENPDGSCSITIGAKTASFPANAVESVTGDGVDNTDAANPVVSQTSAANPVNGVSTVTNFDNSTQELIDESAVVDNADGTHTVTVGAKVFTVSDNIWSDPISVTGDGTDDPAAPTVAGTCSKVFDAAGNLYGLVDDAGFHKVQQDGYSDIATSDGSESDFDGNALPAGIKIERYFGPDGSLLYAEDLRCMDVQCLDLGQAPYSNYPLCIDGDTEIADQAALIAYLTANYPDAEFNSAEGKIYNCGPIGSEVSLPEVRFPISDTFTIPVTGQTSATSWRFDTDDLSSFSVDWGDGSVITYPSSSAFSYTYGAAYTGNVTVTLSSACRTVTRFEAQSSGIGGDINSLLDQAALSTVSSITFSTGNTLSGDLSAAMLLIPNIAFLSISGSNTLSGDAEAFFNNAPNLGSLNLAGANTFSGDIGSSNISSMYHLSVAGANTLYGDVAGIGAGAPLLELISIRGSTTISGDISSFGSGTPILEYFELQGSNTVSGDMTAMAIMPMLGTFRVLGQNTISGDISTFFASNSALTLLDILGFNTVSGDVGASPPAGLTFCRLGGNNTASGDLAALAASASSLTFINIVGNTTVSGSFENVAASATGLTHFIVGGTNTVSGDVGAASLNATGLTSFSVTGLNTLSGNIATAFANHPSLTIYQVQGSNTLSGDLAVGMVSATTLTDIILEGSNTVTMGSVATFPASMRGVTLLGAAKSQLVVDRALASLAPVAAWTSSQLVDVSGVNAAPSAAGLADAAIIAGNGATVVTN